MTSPVRTEALGGEGGGHRVSFVLPSKYSLKSLPVPADARVKLREVGSHVAAAPVRFTRVHTVHYKTTLTSG